MKQLNNRKQYPSISIFFPFLNDWGTVGSLISLSIETVSKLTDDWEVLIIDDGSKSADKEALEYIVRIINKGYKKEAVRVITHEKNRGYGGALRSGFENSTKDLVFYTDCDAQYDPRELMNLYKEMKPGIGMVNGYKIKRNDPIIRIIAGRFYHHLVKLMFSLPIRDTDCDFRLIRRTVFDRVKLFESTGTICTELVKKVDHAGYKIMEVPVHHYYRTSGKSQFFNFKRLYKTGTNLLKLWWKLIIKNDYVH